MKRSRSPTVEVEQQRDRPSRGNGIGHVDDEAAFDAVDVHGALEAVAADDRIEGASRAVGALGARTAGDGKEQQRRAQTLDSHGGIP
jgi:hypothetical protein